MKPLQAKRTTRTLLLLLLVACTCMVKAQYVTDFKRTAELYFEKGDYYTAAQYFEKYLTARQLNMKSGDFLPYAFNQKKAGAKKKESNDYGYTVYKLAESYRLYNDFTNAEHWYGIAVQTDSAAYPLAPYWYGVCLRANTKYADAEAQLSRFLQTYKQNDDYAEKARKELANCRFIQQQLAGSGKRKVKMRRLNSFINQGGANYAPMWMNATTFMFTSSRADSSKVKGANKNPYMNALYKTLIVRDTIMGTAEKVNVKDTKEMQQGVASLSYDGKKMFLTRWVSQDGRNVATLYSSVWGGTDWSEPEKLSNLINLPGSSNEQPFVTSDGKYLIFASDRPGGIGKYDLWYCVLDASGNPGTPVNMGSTINTRDDENAPFYHTATQTLVFASNGRVGMGGYDLFTSKGDFTANWQDPQNMGYPVNSTKDDIYFTSRDSKYLLKDAYFSSDRSSVCCLELFSLRRANQPISGKIRDCSSGAPLVGATVSLVDTIQNKIVYTQDIDATGSFNFEVEEFKPLKVVATKNHYLTGYVYLEKPGDAGVDTLMSPDLCLNHEDTAKPYPVNRPVVMKNIFYDFNKSSLRPESYPVLDTLASVMRMYPNMAVELSAHTDSKGTDQYNLKLSAARAQSCVDYLVQKAGINASRITSKGFGECCPVAPNTTPTGKDNPDGRALNRRTELKVLHY